MTAAARPGGRGPGRRTTGPGLRARGSGWRAALGAVSLAAALTLCASTVAAGIAEPSPGAATRSPKTDPSPSPTIPTTAPGTAASPTASPSPSSARGPASAGDLLQAAAEELEPDPVGISLTTLEPALLRPADELTVTAEIHNRGRETIRSPQASLSVARFRFSSRAALDEWADSGLTGATGTRLRRDALPEDIPPDGRVMVSFTVSASELRLLTGPDAWGPRGIVVDLAAGGERLGVLRSFVLWLPTEQVEQVQVSLIAPLTLPATTGDDDAIATTLSEATSGTGPLGRVLGATGARPYVAWAIDPALVVAGETTHATPESAAWLARLADRTGGRELFSLAPWDPDLAVLAAAGRPMPLGALPEQGPLGQSLADAWRTDLAWPGTATTTQPAIDLAVRSGARVVLTPGALEAEDLAYTPTGRTTVHTPTTEAVALVPDRELSTQLASPPGGTAASARQRLLAETAVIARERPAETRHVLIAAPRDWTPSVPVATGQLDGLEAAPWVTTSPLSALIGAPDPKVDRTPPPATGDPGGLAPGTVDDLLDARATASSLASSSDDPAPVQEVVDRAVLPALSTAWRHAEGSGSRLSDAVSHAEAAVAVTIGRVAVVPGSTVNLITDSGALPVSLRNDLDQAVTLQVGLRPDDPRLVTDQRGEIAIPAHSTGTVRIPATAVGSGDVDVAVEVFAADGTLLSRSAAFTVRVRPDWENVGTAVVAALLGIAFVVGIVRTVRRGKPDTRTAAVPIVPAPDAGPQGAAAGREDA